MIQVAVKDGADSQPAGNGGGNAGPHATSAPVGRSNYRFGLAGGPLLSVDRDRVTRALDLLTRGFVPFAERELKAAYGDDWIKSARGSFREDHTHALPAGDVIRWDAHTLLTVVWDQWNAVFRKKLGRFERSLVNELREFRNRWAHQEPLTPDDAYRIWDSVERLLLAASAAEACEARRHKRELLHAQFSAELQAELPLPRLRNNKWLIVTLNLFCCLAIVVQLTFSWGWNAAFVAAVVVLVFAYLTHRQLKLNPQSRGPHECPACKKVIYSSKCPYCGAVPAIPDAVTTQA